MAEVAPIMEIKEVSKDFPGVRALSKVDFRLFKGEVHAIMGQNGAGKSTLIKVMTGVHQQDAGGIFLDGREIRPSSPLEAQKLGISTVYQEVNLCPNLTVAENIFIGRQPMKYGRIHWQKMNREAEALLKEKLSIDIDVTQLLSSYSLAIQQMTAIVRVLDISSKVLILDEPTSSLNRNEVELLFDVIRKLRDQGLAIVFITHFLEQAYEIADRITVLRNGIVVGEYRTEDLPRYELISKMVGRDLAEKGLLEGESLKKAKSDPLPQGEVTLTANGLGKQGSINPFDIDIKSGEIVGVAGLLGSGRTEMVKLLFGVDRPDHGETRIRGERKRIASPGDAIALGMGFCPENRKEEGVVEELSLRENIILALQGKMGIFRTIPERKQQEIAEKFIEVLDIQAHSTEQEVRTLSGGNQQKVMLARWLATEPEILFLDEPTRGIDVGAKVEIMDLIVRLREQGMAIVVVSSEFEEVISLSDRIVVLRDKSKVAELSGDEIAEENILQTIAGGS